LKERTTLDHLILTVSNVERSLAFYEAALKPLNIKFFLPYKGECDHPDLWGFGDGKRGVLLDQAREARSSVHSLGFPVGRHPSCWSGSELISRVRMRRKQLYTLDHRLLLVIEEPILTRLKTGYDLMPVAAPCFDAC
jgi:catechol 2,3-dioxygenase-like lactoylglutathione lyase family enzyme